MARMEGRTELTELGAQIGTKWVKQPLLNDLSSFGWQGARVL